jgi:sugar phosphate isomerase/epimerase
MKTLFLLLLTTAALAQQPAPVGLQLYTFRNQFKTDVPGTLAKIQQMGFREVEGGNTYGMAPADFKKLLDTYGLKTVSMGASFADLENNVPEIIQKAQALGARYVTCAWIPHTGDVFTKADADRAVEVFNTAGRLLADAKIKFCYHTHGYEFGPAEGFSGNYFDYLAANLEPAYANFEMDVYWVKAPGQDPIDLLKKYPKRFPLVHLKDRKPGTPLTATGHADVETNVALGDGDIGIAQFMPAAKKAGVKHFFIEDESSRSLEQVPKSIAFLRGLK